MSRDFTHHFRAPIRERNMGENARGTLIYQVVYAPRRVVRALELGPTERCRIVGELEGEPIRLALNPAKDATHFLMVSKALCKKVDRGVGQSVEVRFDVEDPDAVAVPELLMKGLDADPAAAEVWHGLRAGKQRIWTTQVERAKRAATQARRVEEVLDRLKTGALDPRQK